MLRNEKIPAVFHQRLCLLRKASGMTQQELCEHLHLRRSTYSYYETGATSPSLEILQRIATEFDVSLDYLLGMDTLSTSVVHQSLGGLNNTPSALDGAALFAECDHEERTFISLLRRLTEEEKEKVVMLCADMLTARGQLAITSSGNYDEEDDLSDDDL